MNTTVKLSEAQKAEAKRMVDAFLPDFKARLSPVAGDLRRYQLEYTIENLTAELNKILEEPNV